MNIKYDKNGNPKIGGLLYLVSINIIGSIIAPFYTIFTDINFLSKFKKISEIYNLLVFEIIIQLLIVVYAVYIAHLFFNKKCNFVRQYCFMHIGAIVYSFLSVFLGDNFLSKYNITFPIQSLLYECVGATIIKLVIILYLINSKRVKNTFIINGDKASNINTKKCSYCAEESVFDRFIGKRKNNVWKLTGNEDEYTKKVINLKNEIINSTDGSNLYWHTFCLMGYDPSDINVIKNEDLTKNVLEVYNYIISSAITIISTPEFARNLAIMQLNDYIITIEKCSDDEIQYYYELLENVFGINFK